jgi:hypothetical protein
MTPRLGLARSLLLGTPSTTERGVSPTALSLFEIPAAIVPRARAAARVLHYRGRLP